MCAKIDTMILLSIPDLQNIEVQRIVDNKANPHNRTSIQHISMIDTPNIQYVDNEADARAMLDKNASRMNVAVNYHRYTFTCTKIQ